MTEPGVTTTTQEPTLVPGEPEVKTEVKTENTGDSLSITRSELDSLVSKAVAKNQEKLSKQLEREQLEKAGEWQKLLEQEREKTKSFELRIAASDIISKTGLPADLLDELIALGDPTRMQSLAEKLAKATATLVDDKIRDRMKTPGAPTTKEQTPASILTSAEEYAKARLRRR